MKRIGSKPEVLLWSDGGVSGRFQLIESGELVAGAKKNKKGKLECAGHMKGEPSHLYYGTSSSKILRED